MNKRATIYDIAARLGISIATVNRALANKPRVSAETRQRVLAVAKEMNFVPNSLARSLSRQPIRLATVAFTSFPEFHNSFLAGVKASAEQLRDFNVAVDCFSYDRGATYSTEADVFLNETFSHIADNNYNGALICGKTSSQTRILSDKGVVVATAINDTEPSMRSFCVKYNGRVGGRVAAELLWHFGDKTRPVLIASGGEPKYSIHTEMIEGFMEQLSLTPLQMVGVYNHYDDPHLAYQETVHMLDQYPNLGGIYVNTFNSLGVVKAVVERGLGGRICLVTSDIYQELTEYLQAGIVAASIFQNQYQQGKKALRMLYDSIADGISMPDTTMIEPQIILQSNLELFWHQAPKSRSTTARNVSSSPTFPGNMT